MLSFYIVFVPYKKCFKRLKGFSFFIEKKPFWKFDFKKILNKKCKEITFIKKRVLYGSVLGFDDREAKL